MYKEIQKASSTELSISKQLEESEYTKACIEETMRLYPPAYFSDRIAIADDTYKGMKFSKGTIFLISFFDNNFFNISRFRFGDSF